MDYGHEYDNNNESPEMVGNEDHEERKHGNLGEGRVDKDGKE
jgi:hypothetical protein